MISTTVSRLRRVLSDYFEPAPVNTAIKLARNAAQIPHGRAGYGGVGSAPVTVPQALLVVLGLCAKGKLSAVAGRAFNTLAEAREFSRAAGDRAQRR
jgi:hypothetical protein